VRQKLPDGLRCEVQKPSRVDRESTDARRGRIVISRISRRFANVRRER
jgi:hypothetical protein